VNHVSDRQNVLLGTYLYALLLHSSIHSPFVLSTFWYHITTDSGKFTLEGADNVGIVHRVTSILAQHGLCIDKMQTSDEMAPYGGTTLFRMKGIAHAYQPVAAGFDVTKVKTELEQLGEDLNCDIDMVDLAPGEEADVDSA
jgi:formyltetrahydrofolate hydrolase